MVVGDISKGCEVLVIGAGPGGYVAAIRAAQLGKDVMLVEAKADHLGGVCLNNGCIPSKLLLHATDTYHHAKNTRGIVISDIKIDMAELQRWKTDVIEKFRNGIKALCKANNIELITGRARFLDSNKVIVEKPDGTLTIEFQKCIVATGSSDAKIPGIEVDGTHILSSDHVLDLNKPCKSLIIIGGGYIGLESATYLAKLGCQITVVEMRPQILTGIDPEAVAIVKKRLEHYGVTFYLDTKMKECTKDVTVTIETPDGEKTLEAEKMLIAVGRTPNTEDLGLENTQVQLDKKGYMETDEVLLTTDPHIYAIGDCCGKSMLAHTASRQAKIAVEAIVGKDSNLNYANAPYVVFTDPEIAVAGVVDGTNVKIGKFPLMASARSLINDEKDGFVKWIADKETDKLLGCVVVGRGASDLIGEAVIAIEKGMTAKEVGETIHPHPTMPEALMEAAEAVWGSAIHIINKKNGR